MLNPILPNHPYLAPHFHPPFLIRDGKRCDCSGRESSCKLVRILIRLTSHNTICYFHTLREPALYYYYLSYFSVSIFFPQSLSS